MARRHHAKGQGAKGSRLLGVAYDFEDKNIAAEFVAKADPAFQGSRLGPGPQGGLRGQNMSVMFMLTMGDWIRLFRRCGFAIEDLLELQPAEGARTTYRTPEQTEIAQFWAAIHPIIYLPVAYSMAPRDIAYNARYLAVVAMAVDDALGAIFDAKYTYTFWRPVTAIRNGDIDGNDATERDASWLPLIDTPMHPEYPCAHCVISGTIGTFIKPSQRGRKRPS